MVIPEGVVRFYLLCRLVWQHCYYVENGDFIKAQRDDTTAEMAVVGLCCLRWWGECSLQDVTGRPFW
jgi:hypothetical protein